MGRKVKRVLRNTFVLIFSLVFVCIGTGIVITNYQEEQFLKSADSCLAYVNNVNIESKMNCTRGGSAVRRYYHTNLSYTVNDIKYDVPITTKSPIKEGEYIKIYYSPENPKIFDVKPTDKTRSTNYVIGIISIIFGIVVLIVCIIILRKISLENSKIERKRYY